MGDALFGEKSKDTVLQRNAMTRSHTDNAVWSGSVHAVNGDPFVDLHLLLAQTENFGFSSLNDCSLEYLALVHPERIPLQLVAGPSLHASATNEHTRKWLEQKLQCLGVKDSAKSSSTIQDPESSTWLERGVASSDIGILVRVVAGSNKDASTLNPRITEILIYAERTDLVANSAAQEHDGHQKSLHSAISYGDKPRFKFVAIPLSSELLYQPADISAPITNDGILNGVVESNVVAQPVQKRDRLGDLFDQATDRRKKARRRGGESISVAASKSVSSPTLASLRAFDDKQIKPEPEESYHGVSSPAVQVVSARRRVEPTLASTKPSSPAILPHSGRGSSALRKQSLRPQGTTQDKFEDSSFEARNKQTISRTVMASMRIYGLTQPRRVTARSGNDQTQSQIQTADPQQIPDIKEDAVEERDAEYKVVYHQAYKGTLFAFRRSVETALLKPAVVHEVVDRLLAVFCQDPLQEQMERFVTDA